MLSSTGSSSKMFTPAINASSTSEPCVIIDQAFCKQVMSPPFLNLFPLADEITTGLIDLLGVMFGVSAGSLRDAEASRVAPAVVRMKSRRFMRKQLNEGLRA